MKAVSEQFNVMVQPSNTVGQNLAVELNKLHIPRKFLLEQYVFQDNLPIDFQIKLRILKKQEEITPYIYSQYQTKVDYVQEHIVITFNYKIEFPLKISELQNDMSLDIVVSAYKLQLQQNFNLFSKHYELEKFNNNYQTLSFDCRPGCNLYFEVQPNSGNSLIIYNVEPQIPDKLKCTFKQEYVDSGLKLDDFEQIINGNMNDQQLIQLMEQQRQFFQFEIYKQVPIEEPIVIVKANWLQQQDCANQTQGLTHQQVGVSSKNIKFDIMQLLEETDNTKLLDKIIQEINTDGILTQDNQNQLQIYNQTDFDIIQNQLHNGQQRFYYNKNPLDYVFFYAGANNINQQLQSKQNQYQQSILQQNIEMQLNYNFIQNPTPVFYEQEHILQVLNQSYLDGLSQSDAAFLYKFHYFIIQKYQKQCFYKLILAFIMCDQFKSNYEIFKNQFDHPQMSQILMILDLSSLISQSNNTQLANQQFQKFYVDKEDEDEENPNKKYTTNQLLRQLAVQYLKQHSVKEIQSVLMQLSLQIQDDTNLREMAVFLVEESISPDKCYQLSQFYFYIDCWKNKCVEKNQIESIHKFMECQMLLMTRCKEINIYFYNELIRSIQLITELRGMVRIIKELEPNDRQQQLAFLKKEIVKRDAYPTLTDSTQSTMFPFILRHYKPCRVRGVNPEKVHVFKSAKKPFLIYLYEEVETQVEEENFDSELSSIAPLASEDVQTTIPGDFCVIQNQLNVQITSSNSPTNNEDVQVVNASHNSITYKQNSPAQTQSQLVKRIVLETKELPLIFKFNDDVRNDVMVLQLFKIMDQQLKLNNMFLEPTHYTAFAFDSKFGMVEVVHPCISIDDIIINKDYQTIQKYFETMQQQEPQLIKSQMLKYIKSLALYSVMTYVLAIGDRHLENILLQPSGKIVHIDFGWLFGRDPKPRPAKMKISPEMINGLGGVDHPNFNQFMSYLVSVFITIRKSSNYILSLILLLRNSGIKVVEEDLLKNFDWLQARLQMSLDDEQASFQMTQIVNDQLQAVFPKIIDALHRWIQNQRK